MDGLPTIQSRIKRKSKFQICFCKVQKRKNETRNECSYFYFSNKTQMGCGYVLFDKHSEGWFFAYLSKKFKPQNTKLHERANHVGEPFCFQNLRFFFLLFNPVWIFPKILAKLFSTFPPFPLFFKNAPLISPPTLKYSFCFVFQ